ncbi:hypothetical protein EST38_g7708 [Candolleomyces aberdarensis]|uniref:DUF6533 domain-containing protein n=1 Tax=Candolleomyces aberdarensis TaxID=2316362 RepID=A0A4Q2DEG3_9AGAR|nr:hypothetical protein EST38_g7708 [Candolleomyces aberdarensis]
MFREEVEKIWSQRWMLGKILFLLTQYSTLLGIIPYIVLQDRIHIGAMDFKACLGLYWFTNIMMMIVSHSAEASLWLCLYALLGTKKRYLILFTTLFLLFVISSATFGLRYISTVRAVPISPDNERLGYGCDLVPSSATITLSTFTIVAYLNLAKTALVAIAGVVTLLVRYRRQNNTLLNVIRREGGIYFLSMIVLRVCDTIFRTPGSPVKDEYKIVQVYVHTYIPLFPQL